MPKSKSNYRQWKFFLCLFVTIIFIFIVIFAMPQLIFYLKIRTFLPAVEEIYADMDIYSRPLVSEDSMKWVFVDQYDGPNQLFLIRDNNEPLQLTMDHSKKIPLDFSPNQQELLYFQSDSSDTGELLSYNFLTGKTINLTETPNVDETRFACWSGNGEKIAYLASEKLTNTKHQEVWIKDLASNKAVRITNDQQKKSYININYSGDELFYIEDSLDVIKYCRTTKTQKNLTNFENGQTRWLTISPDGKRLLFAASASSDLRQVYEFNLTDVKLQQLTNEPFQTYTPRYLSNSKIAYIVFRDNRFLLKTIDVKDNHIEYLEEIYHCYEYFPVLNKNELFVIGCDEFAPQGLWKYNINKGELFCLGKRKIELKYAEISQPICQFFNSFDSLSIPVLIVPPVRKRRSKLYPLVIYAPPPTVQFMDTWEVKSQTSANLEFYWCGVNYRGCDGYGHDYRSWRLKNPDVAARDLIAAREMMLARYEDIDPNKVFLFTESAGFYTMFRAILLEPELWYKAIALLAKLPDTSDPDFKYQATYPPILWLHGELDKSIPIENVMDACDIFNILGMNVKLIVLPHTGHYPIDTRDLEYALKEILQFIII